MQYISSIKDIDSKHIASIDGHRYLKIAKLEKDGKTSERKLLPWVYLSLGEFSPNEDTAYANEEYLIGTYIVDERAKDNLDTLEYICENADDYRFEISDDKTTVKIYAFKEEEGVVNYEVSLPDSPEQHEKGYNKKAVIEFIKKLDPHVEGGNTNAYSYWENLGRQLLIDDTWAYYNHSAAEVYGIDKATEGITVSSEKYPSVNLIYENGKKIITYDWKEIPSSYTSQPGMSAPTLYLPYTIHYPSIGCFKAKDVQAKIEIENGGEMTFYHRRENSDKCDWYIDENRDGLQIVKSGETCWCGSTVSFDLGKYAACGGSGVDFRMSTLDGVLKVKKVLTLNIDPDSYTGTWGSDSGQISFKKKTTGRRFSLQNVTIKDYSDKLKDESWIDYSLLVKNETSTTTEFDINAFCLGNNEQLNSYYPDLASIEFVHYSYEVLCDVCDKQGNIIKEDALVLTGSNWHGLRHID